MAQSGLNVKGIVEATEMMVNKGHSRFRDPNCPPPMWLDSYLSQISIQQLLYVIFYSTIRVGHLVAPLCKLAQAGREWHFMYRGDILSMALLGHRPYIIPDILFAMGSAIFGSSKMLEQPPRASPPAWEGVTEQYDTTQGLRPSKCTSR